jgi:hypothetical protein
VEWTPSEKWQGCLRHSLHRQGLSGSSVAYRLQLPAACLLTVHCSTEKTNVTLATSPSFILLCNI